MPAQNGYHQQRRVFRGRGGATDRSIPPKKHHRSKVKYQNEEESGIGYGVNHNNNIEVDDGRHDLDDGCHDIEGNVQNLSLDSNDAPSTPPPTTNTDTKLFRELKHLNKRIDNVQTSLQTSQLTNPSKWKMNCLLPVRNIVKEWRSILRFHNISLDVIQRSSCKHDDDEEADQIPAAQIRNNNSDSTNSGVDNVHYDDATKDLFKSTSQKVFSLIQMSMQTGPLVGSNPGYMKRCGGEVTSIALDYLNEIVDLATTGDVVVEKVENEEGCVDSINRSEEVIQDIATDCAGDQIQLKKDAVDDSDKLESASDSESSDSSADEDNDDISHTQIDSLESNNKADTSSSVQEKRDITMNNLQTTLLFTEKQSQRFCQWLRNAETGTKLNKAPTKSAKKLQNQKSKKQMKKEMKVERKLKSKKKQR